MLENDKNFTVIKVSDYYPDNCSEQEYAEVSDEILRAYDDFKKYEERQRNQYRRHVNRFVDIDTVLEMQNEAAVVFDEDHYLDEVFFGMLAGRCSDVTYLSGNVREKLKVAREYAKHIDSSFERNAAALEKVIPKNLEASEISVRIGANWIDVEDYNKFLHEYAKADTGMFGHPVTRTRMGEYKIEGKYQDHSVAANQTYGTSRMSSYHIFENLLNQRDIVIRDRREEDGRFGMK